MKKFCRAGCLALMLSGCASLSQPFDVPATVNFPDDAARLILITVANPSEPVAARAGSTLRGYDAVPHYAEAGSARAAIASLAEDFHLIEVAAWPILPLDVHCGVFEIPSGVVRAELLQRLASDPRVRLAQPLQTFATLGAGYNDPYFGLQRGFVQIDAADAQQWSRGDGVRVAVIDTGVDRTHPDLRGRIELQRNFVDDDAHQFDADRHGTEVVGVIAADANNREGIVGVAPGVRILAFKACWQLQAGGDAARCNSFTLAQALTIAIESGAQVINLSLGGPADPLLAQLVAYALSRGIVVVGAVPPDGRLDGFPIGVPGVIAVDVIDRPERVAATLGAPGREVLTLEPGGHYDFASGSSLATAHVSGAIALLLAANSRLRPAEIRDLLVRTSLPIGADENRGEAINICAALAALNPADHCSETSLLAPSAPVHTTVMR